MSFPCSIGNKSFGSIPDAHKYMHAMNQRYVRGGEIYEVGLQKERKAQILVKQMHDCIENPECPIGKLQEMVGEPLAMSWARHLFIHGWEFEFASHETVIGHTLSKETSPVNYKENEKSHYFDKRLLLINHHTKANPDQHMGMTSLHVAVLYDWWTRSGRTEIMKKIIEENPRTLITPMDLGKGMTPQVPVAIAIKRCESAVYYLLESEKKHFGSISLKTKQGIDYHLEDAHFKASGMSYSDYEDHARLICLHTPAINKKRGKNGQDDLFFTLSILFMLFTKSYF